MTLLAFPLVTFLPVFARDVFRGGPSLYTVFLVCSGIGSICGALVTAGSRRGHQGRTALLQLLALGALIASFALSRSLIFSCVLIFFSGAALLSVFATISSLVQIITPDNMRGRVMSVY